MKKTHGIGGKVVRLLKLSIAAAALIVMGAAGLATWLYAQARLDTSGQHGFANQLAIPPLLEPTIEEGRKVFDLTLEAGQTEFLSGALTDTWGVNGTYLAPTLRAARGDRVLINVTNTLGESTTLHWHGMHLPAAMDGGPHQMIGPGETWSPTWTIRQPAATLWYHPHLMGKTSDHVYRGVAGLFLLDEPGSEAPDLPQTYGVDDVPLIIQDKRFDEDGSLSTEEGPANLVGVLGDQILVNGTHDPHFEASTTLVRFRILNASNARVYNLGFSDDRTFWVAGTDTGLLEAPVEVTQLQLSAGERAEIVLRLDPGDRTTLRSFPPDLGMNFLLERMNGGDDTLDILQVRARDRLRESAPLPSALATIDRPDEEEVSSFRSFDLSGFSRINGREMDMGRVDAVIVRDTTEIWEIRNNSNTFHNFHVHDIHFAILDIDGGDPPPHLRGWKDTIFLPPGRSVRIIARFEDYADPTRPLMFHCHILAHEDAGMMGQLVVVEPGETPPALRDHEPPHHPSSSHSHP